MNKSIKKLFQGYRESFFKLAVLKSVAVNVGTRARAIFQAVCGRRENLPGRKESRLLSPRQVKGAAGPPKTTRSFNRDMDAVKNGTIKNEISNAV